MRNLFLASLLGLATSCASDNPQAASEPAADAAQAGAESTQPVLAEPTPTESMPTEPMNDSSAQTGSSLYALEASSLEGETVDLAEFEGKVTLVVNVASRCGYTGQYAGLQELHDELADRGFSVLAFPSNEFGGQEPGTAGEIREFCSSRFGVTFPVFAKTEVKPGDGQSPVYAFLEGQSGEVPGWNFCKYLVGKDGQVIAFYESGVAPDAAQLREAIETALG